MENLDLNSHIDSFSFLDTYSGYMQPEGGISEQGVPPVALVVPAPGMGGSRQPLGSGPQVPALGIGGSRHSLRSGPQVPAPRMEVGGRGRSRNISFPTEDIDTHDGTEEDDNASQLEDGAEEEMHYLWTCQQMNSNYAIVGGILGMYRARVEAELSGICTGILRLLDGRLVPAAAAVDARVFYLKMKEDYHRYLAEFKTGAERKDAYSPRLLQSPHTLSLRKTSRRAGNKELPPKNPIKLGLALNFSVFYYEILSSPDRACSLAKQAFDEAISELDSLGEESYKDSTLIMQLLRDNLTLWTSDMQEDGGDEMRDQYRIIYMYRNIQFV
ncbi:uncharacterized protein [Zea mays]|uniref:uncharacterized protein n=1 Tax=Zea mays TaxID=4577 RepID=UPI0009AAC4DE|nr:uncharacterized protein LOC103644495 [Zea mays]|eukprot:XP_020396692.1 uncharacterized protein LOC103644495 [Zea mays]